MKRKFLRFFELLLVVFLTGTIASCGPKAPTNDSTNSSGKEDPFGCITIAEAIEIATAAGDTETEEFYTVRGVIESIAQPQYGEMTIKDATGSIYVYGINDYSTMNPKPYKGDEVVINGKLKTYNGKAEFGRSNLLEFTPAPEKPFDETEYEAVTLAEARNKVPGSKVKLTGVVANITYTQKYTPNGFYLVDDTNSIYVYDMDAVQKVKKGNTVTLFATRDDYISSKELSHAEKFGYTGCIQVKDVHLKEVDEKVVDFNKSWIKETTIKKMMETPLSNNITTSIYKVTGYVNKQVNPGFTNYYINDIDNKTGSYVYTSNSGADFEWLDEFDGKLCDLYLSIINAKSSDSGCIYRFMPIEAKLSEFVLEETKVADYVLEYFGETQFKNNYNADPALEVITSVSDEKLSFADAKITYASDNEDAIYFATEADKTIMHTKNDGTANVTINVTYKAHTATKTISITKSSVDVSGTITIKEAIAKEDNATVKVKGIVISSLTNQTGIYLADGSDVIAVRGVSNEISELSIGDEIYVEGTKKHFHKPEHTDLVGQLVIDDAKVLLNTYGKHEIPTNTFIKDKTFADIIALDPHKDDVTNNIYQVEGKVAVIIDPHYTAIKITSTDGASEIALYSSSAKQYSWLEEFKDEEKVTFTLALCNWNDKGSYKACVLSASNGTKTIYNELNFKK